MIDRDSLIGKLCYINYINIATNQIFEFEIVYPELDDFVKLANSGLCDVDFIGDTSVSLTIYN